MPRLPLLLRARQDATVAINGLYVPIDQAKFSLERFSRPLYFHNEGSEFEVSVAGSCFLARIAGENFLIATRHQLMVGGTERDETEVCIALFDAANATTPTLLTPGGSVRIGGAENFEDDVLILRFERETSRAQELAGNFLRLDEVDSDPQDKRVLQYLTIAWPSSGSSPMVRLDGLGYDEFRSGFVRLGLTKTDAPTPANHIAFQVREEIPRERDFDGYSGAPVYFLYKSAGEVKLGWVGIIRMGGNGILHCFRGRIVRELIASSRALRQG